MRTSALSLLNLLFKCFAFSTRLNRSQCIFVRTGLRLHPFPSLIYYSTPSLDPFNTRAVCTTMCLPPLQTKPFQLNIFPFPSLFSSHLSRLFVFSRFSKIFFSDATRLSVFSSGQCCTQVNINTFYLYSFTFFYALSKQYLIIFMFVFLL